MSIQLRLTLWYIAVLAATLILFGTTVYFVAYQALHTEIDRSLVTKTDEILKNTTTRPTAGGVIKLDPPIKQPANAETYIQLLDDKLNLVRRTDNLADESLPIDPAIMQRVLAGDDVFQNTRIDNVELRQYNHVVRIKDNATGEIRATVGIIQVARSLEPIQNMLAQLRIILVITSLGSLLLAGLVGWLLARAALAPIDRITQEARAIGQEQDLRRRLNTPHATDEIGRLAATFNDMLARLQASLERQQAALIGQRRFVADASHELRTPLTTIRGNVALLQRMRTHVTAGSTYPENDEAEREALNDISSESERMSRLVNDMLTLARADAGQRLTHVTLQLRPLVEEVFRQARILRDQKNPTLRLELEGVADVTLNGDPDALRQLLLILLDNAIKYTPAGGRVGILLENCEDLALLQVKDTGNGIAPEDLPHIFERFYRADRARSHGGTGLGLSIARWIAEQHGGTLQAESTPSVGSTFTLSLPLHQQPE